MIERWMFPAPDHFTALLYMRQEGLPHAHVGERIPDVVSIRSVGASRDGQENRLEIADTEGFIAHAYVPAAFAVDLLIEQCPWCLTRIRRVLRAPWN